MFKKSKRNLRQRKEDSEEENDDVMAACNAANGANIASVKANRKKKSKEKTHAQASNSEKKSLLSFGLEEDDENTEVFQLKKSSRSKRIAKQIKRLAQEEREQIAAPGEYSKERLAELKKSSMTPQSLQSTLSSSAITGYSPADENGETQSVGFSSAVNGVLSFRPGEIPNANRIHAARKQREMMRKYGADYIPVENTETMKKPTNSRLVREDDMGSSSEEEVGPSVAMKGIIDDGIRVAKEIGSHGEGALHRDEEFDLWEAEMIKKGTGTQQYVRRGDEWDGQQTEQSVNYEPSYPVNGGHKSTDATAAKSALNTVFSPAEMVVAVKKRVEERLECLQQVHRTHQLDMERTLLDVKESENTATNLGDTTSLSKQYTFFQDAKAYIRDLIDCLSEKNIEIEALEKRRHNLWRERTDLFVSRRRQDVVDESSDITSAPNTVKVTPVMTPADAKKQTRVREREARRSRRRSARERLGTQKIHIDGTSTDEEETSMDKAKFGAELEKICKFKETIFDDVVEEFHDVQIIMARFDEWRKKYPGSYNDAYIGLCLPRILSPFVRLAMLHWNPLEVDCGDFEDMTWYEDLLFYGIPKDSQNFEPVAGDSDNKVLSSLFERVVLPKLASLVRDTWDPLSSGQSHRLSLLLCRLVRNYPCMRPENRRCNELMLALCTRIQSTIDNDIFIPLYPTSALTNTSSGPGSYFERQTWTCIKLYENVLIFNGILSQEVLYELVFTSLLNRYIMLSLQTSPITTVSVQKCQRIFDAIPPEWLKNEADSGLLTHLASFSRYLLHSAKHIHGQLSVTNDADKRRARNCIACLGKLLSQIGEEDFSDQVLKLLGVKTLL